MVERKKREDDEEQSRNFTIFVAVARCDTNKWPGYLSDCIIYELDGKGLDGKGQVKGVVTLPRFVQEAKYSVMDHTVVWSCEHGGLAKLMNDVDDRRSDSFIDFEWRVHRPRGQQKVWMQDGTWIESVAFGGHAMFRVQRGSYVETRDAQLCRLPISMIDLKTGAEAEMILNIPFEGTIPIPKQNYSVVGDDEWTLFGSFPLALNSVAIRGDRFAVSVKTESGEQSMEFDLASVITEKPQDRGR